jgi:hypothetical protein
MPIALRAVPRVLESLSVVFQNEELIPYSSRREDNDLDYDIQGAIVQLDYPADDSSKGALPGLSWLESKLAHQQDWHRLPIVLTAWNPEVFVPGSQRMLNETLGAQSIYGLLESPLLRFFPMRDLLQSQGLKQIKDHFQEVATIENDILEDISKNCYQQADTASSCHRLQQLMSSMWQMYNLRSGAPVVERFRRDLNDMRARVGGQLSPIARGPFEKDVEQILARMSKCKKKTEFQRHFRSLEARLHDAEETQINHYFPPLNGKLLLISHDYAFATEFEQMLEVWEVAIQVVKTAESALEALNANPLIFSCLLSDFRMHTDEGKLSTRQGYTELAAVAQEYPNLPSAYVTGMYGARWSQPRKRGRSVFDKEELHSANSPTSEALYQFLSAAVEQLENQRLSLPKKMLKGKKIFARLLAYNNVLIQWLQPEGEELCQWASDFFADRPPRHNFELAKQKYIDEAEFLRERLFLRLLIIFLIRIQAIHEDGVSGKHYKDYLRRVLNYLWPPQDTDWVSKHHQKTIQYQCADFLRIFGTKQYHSKSVLVLLKEELIFPHEVYLLPKLEKQFSETYLP